MEYIATERIRGEDGARITVRGRSIEEAAEHAVNRLVGRRALAWRCTGDAGLSGIFQGYVSCNGSGIVNLTSRGPNIHMRPK